MTPKDGFEKKGGRKKASFAAPDLENNLRQVVADHTAGDPMREDVVWTYLSSTEIAHELDRLGTPVCPDTVRSLLDEFGFHKRLALCEPRHARSVIQILTSRRREARLWRRRWLA